MGTITLPTYQSQQIDRPALGGSPRPDLQGMAALGQAQNRFIETLFGAGEFAAKLISGAKARDQSDGLGNAQNRHEANKTDLVLSLEKVPISIEDPRYAEIPEGERSVPNLSFYQKTMGEKDAVILGGIKDPEVKQAFQKWLEGRQIAEKQAIGSWDVGKQHELGFKRTLSSVMSAIEAGNVGIADDHIANGLHAGYFDDNQAAEYRDLARKDVTKRNAFLKAQSLGDVGMAFLANSDNLRYTGVDGSVKEMPIADRENIVQRFKDDLSWQDRQTEVFNDNLDSKLSDALLARKQGKGNPSSWFSLGMIGDMGFKGKTASSHKQFWMDQWDEYQRSIRPSSTSGESTKDPWANSNPIVLQGVIDKRNDPNVSDSDYKAGIRSLVTGGYQGLGRTDAEQYYNKQRPETPISQAVTQIFNKATQGSYPLMSPADSVSVHIALDKEIEAARQTKKPYTDTDIQARVKALMLPYEMANIKARMDKSVSVANQPTEDEKVQYKVWEQAMMDAKQYQALQKGGNYIVKTWERKLENIEAMQSLIDTGKTFGMADNPLLKPHIDALRMEYGKMFQTWSGKPSELKQVDGTPGLTLPTPKYGGRAVYGVKTLDGQNRLFTVKINSKTNDEEWFLFDPKTDATTLVTDPMKVQLFGAKK
jgi:hypothetical protein